MFRKPMRLEKWIAFDGALGVDVLDSVADNAGNETNSEDQQDGVLQNDGDSVFDEAQFFSPMEVMAYGASGWNTIEISTPGPDATLTLPIGFDIDGGTDEFLPFWDSGADFSFTGNSQEAKQFFIEITNPSNGTFSFFNKGDLAGAGFASSDIDQYIAYIDATYNSPGAPIDGLARIYFGKITSASGTVVPGAPALVLDSFTKTVDGNTVTGIRIGVVAVPGELSAEQMFTSLFRSLTFTPHNAGETAAGAFSLSVIFRNETTDLYNSYQNDIFNDGATGMFNPDVNPPAVVVDDATQECNTDGSIKDPNPGPDPDPDPGPDPQPGPDPDPDPEPEPAPEPEPEPDPDPDPDPIPPVVDGNNNVPDTSIGDNFGESGDSQEGGEGGETPGGQDELVYIYRREDDIEDENSVQAGDDAPAALTVEALLGHDGTAGSAAAALALELTREIESMIATVQEDRQTLAQALARLRNEYLSRSARDWGEVRVLLKQLFDSGNREMDAVNRILGEMRRQIDGYRNLPVARRDGMLTESLRELLDIAARRSGETAALSSAINAVADRLAASRQSSGQSPDPAELSKEFDKTFATAVESWLARVGRSDPMGKELSGQIMAGSTIE